MSPFKVLVRSSAIMLPVALLLSALTATSSQARGNDIEFTTGQGEELTIKNGLFGKKTKVVKDRFGNKFEEKKGIFGNKETQVSIFGPAVNVTRKRGLFGGTTYEGSTILGDKVTTRKGLFGRRTTRIDASGTTKALTALLGDKKSKDAAAAVNGSSTANPGAQQAVPDFLRDDAGSNFPAFPQAQ